MLRTATLLPKVGFTYRFSTGIASSTGYMLHGFLALPWQDFHLQAPVSLAGHTAKRHCGRMNTMGGFTGLIFAETVSMLEVLIQLISVDLKKWGTTSVKDGFA